MNHPKADEPTEADEPDKVGGAGRFNLSAAALKFPQLTLFFILILAIGGFIAYNDMCNSHV